MDVQPRRQHRSDSPSLLLKYALGGTIWTRQIHDLLPFCTAALLIQFIDLPKAFAIFFLTAMRLSR